MDRETVSVLMLAHNHGPYVRQAAESVLAQQGGVPFRLWIGEDGSADDTAAVCRALQAEHPDRILVISSTGSAVGMHANFSRLWDASEGPLVAFCEGDDYWCDPFKLQKQVDFLNARSTCTLCGTLTDVISAGEDGRWRKTSQIRPPVLREVYSFRDLIPSYSFHFSSVIVRRSAVLFPDWFAGSYCVDRPLYLLAAQHGEAGLVPEVTSVYRLHPGGQWSTLAAVERSRRSIRLFSDMAAYFPAHYRRDFKTALGYILWSYTGEAVRRGEYRAASAVYRECICRLPFAAVLRNFRQHAGVLFRICRAALSRDGIKAGKS